MAKVGDSVFHPGFGGGATVRVMRVMKRKGWPGQTVRVEIDPCRSGPAYRIWKLSTWKDFVARASAATPPADKGV